MNDRIIIAGPVETAALRSLLDPDTGRLPAGRGGIAVTRLVRGLVRHGYDVTVVTADGAVSPTDAEIVAAGPRLRIRYVPYRARHRARDAFAVERAAVRRAIEREPAGLVHAHWTYEYALGALDTERPTLVTVRDWGPTILRLHPTPYRLVRLGMQVTALRRASALTANSPYLQAKLERWLRRAVPVVPNPIDEDRFGPPRRAPDRTSPVILGVNAGWSRRKNVATLIAAFAEVRRRVAGATLDLVGSEYEPGGPAERWARAHGFGDGIRFIGRVTVAEVLEHMRAADVFVHPAREESFGNVLVEAMAQGTPVVGGERSGAVPWVLDGGHAGVLVDVTSARDVADAIVGLLGDGDRWAELSESGRASAMDRFRTDAVVAAYQREYDAIADTPVRDGP